MSDGEEKFDVVARIKFNRNLTPEEVGRVRQRLCDGINQKLAGGKIGGGVSGAPTTLLLIVPAGEERPAAEREPEDWTWKGK